LVASCPCLPAGPFTILSFRSSWLARCEHSFTTENGRHLTVSYFQRPQEIGVSSVAGLEFPVALQAVTPCTVFRLPQNKFEEIRQGCPAVGWSAAKELARNLDAVLDETSRVAFKL
jgi:CRP-like cAMP-binding protein